MFRIDPAQATGAVTGNQSACLLSLPLAAAPDRRRRHQADVIARSAPIQLTQLVFETTLSHNQRKVRAIRRPEWDNPPRA
jgi:hypothetical protein